MTVVPRALVVGASDTAARLHLPELARLRDKGKLELIEICDLRYGAASAARRRFGFTRDGGDAVTAIAQEDVELVYLFGGARMHCSLGLAAVRAGKHLFVEKPIAPSYAFAMELAGAAEARHVIAVGGHNRRFLAAFNRIRSEAGQSGWSFAEAAFHKPAFGRPAPFGAATWLSGNGIHALDAMVFMMGGLPDWIDAHASGARAAPSVFTALMCWSNGAQAILSCNNEAGGRNEEYAFHTPGQTWRIREGHLTIERNGEGSEIDLAAPCDGFAAEHDAFLEAVATGAQPRHALCKLAPSLFLAELIESGHHGPVRPSSRFPRKAPRPPRQTVLLAGAERLRGSVGVLPEHWSLVSLEELKRSSTPRPDVRAAILAPGSPAIAAELLDKLPSLMVVGVVALSLNRYEPDRLLERGISVVNASHAYAESVAEFALGLAILGRRRAFASSGVMRRGGWGSDLARKGARAALLSLARRVRPFAAKLGIEDRLVRSWRAQSSLAALSAVPAPAHQLAGALVGLVGWGASARAFARRLVAAGAQVIVHSDHASASEICAAGAEPAPLATVLSADIISLHRGLTPATRHSLDAAELARLRPGAVLINVARGALIDPEALVARLRRGDITACLDTFEEEPLPRRHPLRRMANVFLTSHIAGGSPDMYLTATAEVIEKVRRVLEEQDVETVTRERLLTMT